MPESTRPTITYRDTHHFTPAQLQRLFLSVEWSSGQYPQRLAEAMLHFETVYSAWDGDCLIGMVCAMDDHVMTAYVHYLLVDPRYQGQGIGLRLAELVREHYSAYLRIVVVAYDTEVGFYERCGFRPAGDATAMFITSLWT